MSVKTDSVKLKHLLIYEMHIHLTSTLVFAVFHVYMERSHSSLTYIQHQVIWSLISSIHALQLLIAIF